MTLVFPLMDFDPEAVVYLFACLAALVGAVVEWRRGGSEVASLRQDIEVLKQTRASVDDWAALDARCQYLERIINRLVDDWEGGSDDGGEDDA